MSRQDGGWPLGLVRRRSLDFSGSLSFNTRTSCSSTTSSDFDTESTGSFLHERRRSITLGSLIGVTSILELSTRRECSTAIKHEKRYKPRVCFSLCPRAAHLSGSDAPSLGHFLEVERRACNAQRDRSSIAYDVGRLPESQSDSEVPSSLVSNGVIASTLHDHGSDTANSWYWFPLVFPCMR